MSLLPHDTFANSSRGLYATVGSGGGGGGGGSTLTSPASITPAANGSAVLSVAVSGGAGVDATINVTNTTGNDAVIAMSNTAGGNSVIEMGLAASRIVVVAPSGANAGKFNVSPVLPDGSPGVPNLTVDTVGATVTAQNLLLVGQAAFGNQLAAAPLTANTSKVTQTGSAGGSMSIGSSVAIPAGLLVTDIAGNGFTNHVEVGGVSPNASLFLSGAQSGANDCYVFPQVATGGILSLGSNNATNQDAIVLTDTATFISKLGGAPQTLLATVASIASGYTNTSIPVPTGEGLYCVMVGSTPTSNQASRDAQLMTMCYVNSAGRVQIGGNGSTTVIGGGILDLYPLDATSSFALTYTGTGQGLLNISIVAFKISGAIPSAF